MKTYNSTSLHTALSETIKKLHKKFSNPLSFLRSAWLDIAPDWALDAYPYSIKNQTIFLKSKKNPLILQFRERELLKIVKLLLGDTILKVKIFAQ